MTRIILYTVLSVFIFSSCRKDTPTLPFEVDKVKIGEQTRDDLFITLWSDEGTLKTGYNKIYVSIKDAGGNEIKDAVLAYSPLMEMMATSKKHSSPAEQPVYNSDLRLYEGAVVFTMPSSDMGGWQLNLTLNGSQWSFPLTIGESNQKQTGVYTGSDGNRYWLTLLPPAAWQVGLNDVELLIHQQVSMMEFTPVEGLKIEFEPEMPSMGHGSPNNVNPVSVGNGRYKGKVNYTMTGDWRLNFKLIKGDELIVDEAYVEVLF